MLDWKKEDTSEQHSIEEEKLYYILDYQKLSRVINANLASYPLQINHM